MRDSADFIFVRKIKKFHRRYCLCLYHWAFDGKLVCQGNRTRAMRAGGCVKHQKLNKKHYSFEELTAHNRKTENLLKAISKNKALEAKLEGIFHELSVLPLKHIHTNERLDLNELFEIKSFLFYYLHLKQTLQENKLDCLHPLPDMQNLFTLLDPEGNNLPTFASHSLRCFHQTAVDFSKRCLYHTGKERNGGDSKRDNRCGGADRRTCDEPRERCHRNQ